MSISTSKMFVDQLVKLAEAYSSGMRNKPGNLQDYSPEKQKQLLSDHAAEQKRVAMKTLDKISTEVKLRTSDAKTDINKRKYPALNDAYGPTRVLGEQQITNALLVFQNQFLTGNKEFVTNNLRASIEAGRKDYVSSFIENATGFPASDERIIQTRDEVEKIAEKYFDDIGVTDLNNELDVLGYASELSFIFQELVGNKNHDHIYFPDYQSKDFQDIMTLETLRADAGISSESSTQTSVS